MNEELAKVQSWALDIEIMQHVFVVKYLCCSWYCIYEIIGTD